MSELNLRKAGNLSKAGFEEYQKDLKLFLDAFTSQLLAKWLNKDKGNISKKLTGIEPTTRNDIKDFYGKLSSVVQQLKNGVPAYLIELEMETEIAASPETYKNLWQEIRLIKETLQQYGMAIKELQEQIKKS